MLKIDLRSFGNESFQALSVTILLQIFVVENFHIKSLILKTKFSG